MIAATALTLAFQIFASYQYGEQSWWMLGVGIIFLIGSLSMVMRKRAAYMTILVSMLIIPMYWTVMTVTADQNISLPTAYTDSNQRAGGDGLNSPRPQGGPGSSVNEEMLAYLQANTVNTECMLAVPSSQQGSQLVIATGRPVLYMGGFGGQDDVVSAEDLSTMVKNGELRYVLYGGERGNKQEIANWLKTFCSVVPEFSQIAAGGPPAQGPQGQGNQTMALYICK